MKYVSVKAMFILNQNSADNYQGKNKRVKRNSKWNTKETALW